MMRVCSECGRWYFVREEEEGKGTGLRLAKYVARPIPPHTRILPFYLTPGVVFGNEDEALEAADNASRSGVGWPIQLSGSEYVLYDERRSPAHLVNHTDRRRDANCSITARPDEQNRLWIQTTKRVYPGDFLSLQYVTGRESTRHLYERFRQAWELASMRREDAPSVNASRARQHRQQMQQQKALSKEERINRLRKGG